MIVNKKKILSLEDKCFCLIKIVPSLYSFYNLASSLQFDTSFEVQNHLDKVLQLISNGASTFRSNV
jgi:hypothetical protein